MYITISLLGCLLFCMVREELSLLEFSCVYIEVLTLIYLICSNQHSLMILKNEIIVVCDYRKYLNTNLNHV